MRVSKQVRRDVVTYFAARIKELEEQLLAHLPANEGPPVSVLWRIKSERSIAEKRDARIRLDSGGLDRINDFVGLRLVLPHRGFARRALALVRRWAEDLKFSELAFVDSLSAGLDRGYQSVHVDFGLPPPLEAEVGPGLGVEVQITTYLQHFSAIISHQIVYRHGMLVGVDRDVLEKLEALSRALSFADEMASGIFETSRNIDVVSR